MSLTCNSYDYLIIISCILIILIAIPSSNTNDITDNEDDYYPVATATQNPAWWSRKVQRRPILISNGSPIGTGGNQSKVNALIL